MSNTTVRTNGKGTSKEFALASAYGELMERLQNFAPFRLSMDFDQSIYDYGGFYYAPDEKDFTTQELIASDNEWFQLQIFGKNLDPVELTSLLKEWKNVSYEDVPSDFIAIPYKNLSTKAVSYIPIKMSNKMYMSNGMCAGNTREEALIQGISEIMERYVNKKIIRDKITPPTIPKEYLNNYPKITAMIKELETSGNYKIIVKDCSLGKGYPVTCVVFIDLQSSEYFIKFGSSPIFEIAIERTLTELLQGQNIYKMKGLKEFFVTPPITDMDSNIIGILVNGSGYYPKEMFMKTPSYEWVDFHEFPGTTNQDILNNLVDFLENLGHTILVRDVNFLDFPAYHIIMPNFSEVESFDDYKSIRNYSLYNHIKKLVRNSKNLTQEQIRNLIYFITSREFHPMSRITTLLGLEVKKVLPWYLTHISLLLVALYLKINDYENAYLAFDKYVEIIKKNDSKNPMLPYYKCVRNYLDLRAKKVNPKEIYRLLTDFFPVGIIHKVMDEFQDTDYLFKDLNILQCFHCDDCEAQSSCSTIENGLLLKKLKNIYSTMT